MVLRLAFDLTHNIFCTHSLDESPSITVTSGERDLLGRLKDNQFSNGKNIGDKSGKIWLFKKDHLVHEFCGVGLSDG